MAAASPKIDRPKIILHTDEHEVVDEAIQALRSVEELYQRDGQLVRVGRGEPAPNRRTFTSPWIEALPAAALREMLAACARLVRVDESGNERAVHPPEWLVNEVAARGRWPGIRALVGLVSAPVLRTDGTILQAPGYDMATGLLYEPLGDPITIDEQPTLEDARYAAEQLCELVVDFPFVNAGHRSVFLAALLTPFTRYAFGEAAPLFVIDANTPGTGKSLLADVIGMIVTGQPMARMPYVKSDDEMRKRITAVAQQGTRLCLIDNVAGVLGGPGLDAALTGDKWFDRILGETRMTRDLPLHAIWYATGNNVLLGADTGRRALHVRLESNLERPEERRGFAHPDLRRWLALNRAAFVRAVLTIARAYHVANRPRVELLPFGSFDEWSRCVRAPLVWCGCPDPCSTRSQMLESADHEGELVRRVVGALADLVGAAAGLTTGELVDKLWRPTGEKYRADFVEWVGRTDEGGKPQLRALGMKLRHVRGRVVADRQVEKVGPRWVVRAVAAGNSTGTSESRSGSPGRPDSTDEAP